MHCCIDLGSNSFHLLIGEWDEGRIEIIERLSEKVQLGENVASSGRISEAAFERGLACLQRFQLLMKQYPVQKYWALGTNTFRVAGNADEFIAAARVKGIDISIISGVQEAVLIYAGVSTALPVSEARRLVIDVGGGSTEVIVGSGHQRQLTESLALGSVAWRDRFFADTGSGWRELERQMDAGADAARAVIADTVAGVRRAGWDEAYASSGTVKMLSYICQEHGYGEGEVVLAGLHDLKAKLARAMAADTEVPGLKDRRRDLLLPGWCVLTALLESYRVDALKFSATALREGMLDFLVRNEKTLDSMTQSNLPEVKYAKR